MKVVIIDYGAGNVKSVQFAFQRLGIDTFLSDDPETIKSADKVIFPGVGHAESAMHVLRKKNLIAVIKNLKQPVLGICLGMQLLCKRSQEGNTECLGVIDAEVVKFGDKDLKVPQMGWNKIEGQKSNLFKDLAPEFVYYVNSYYVPYNHEYTIATTVYGQKFSGAIQKNNFYGCQFHPEKSGEYGSQLLQNFITLCE